MRKEKKLNKLKVSIAIIIIVLAFTITVFGRYIYVGIQEAYFTARQFYFSSDILTAAGSRYQYSNWGGVDTYAIEFQLFSYNNQLSKLDYDLDYTVTCSTTDTDKIRCSVNSDAADASATGTGTIYATTNTSRVVIYVTPLTTISNDDSVTVTVTASTSVPYQKTLSCEFTLEVETDGISTYSIEDVTNRDYALLKLVNANDTSSQITLEFDPSKLRLDMNDEIYINKTSVETSTISGNQYVKKISFSLPAETTRYVKFYKVDKAQNYTYPGVEDTCAIKVTM